MTEDFNKWWDSEPLIADNLYPQDTPVYWAWEGWQAGIKAERKPLMTDEEYEQAMADEGQRRMLEIDTEVRAMIKEAVEAEREECAKYFEDSDYMMYRSEVAAAIRARGQS
jgi:hypothetical protein